MHLGKEIYKRFCSFFFLKQKCISLINFTPGTMTTTKSLFHRRRYTHTRCSSFYTLRLRVFVCVLFFWCVVGGSGIYILQIYVHSRSPKKCTEHTTHLTSAPHTFFGRWRCRDQRLMRIDERPFDFLWSVDQSHLLQWWFHMARKQ